MKIKLKDFSSRQEDWEDWSIEHLAKESMGFVDELTTPEGRDIKVGAEGFDAREVDPVRLRYRRGKRGHRSSLPAKGWLVN